MYVFWGILFLVLLFFFCINLRRRKKIIKKIYSMCLSEKCSILNRLLEPFGYSYVASQDLFTTRTDAWQREFGYCALYDKAAPHFKMIFDCLPVYFDYEDRTWLIEFWKGQYGINTGCEIGVYYADRILRDDEREKTLFRCVENRDMLNLSYCLLKNHHVIAHLRARHWWLTGFDTGCFSRPSELSLQASVTLRSARMADAFARGLKDAGYDWEKLCVHCNTVTFTFSESTPACGILSGLRIRIAQWSNRFWCRVYLFVTRPFCRSVDRLLYLYYFLPFAFRKMLRFKKYKRRPK